MKEENTQRVELEEEIEFDGKKIKVIRFDLKHINQGWDEEKRDYCPKGLKRDTRYKAEDIIDFFEQYGLFEPEWEIGRNKEKISIKGKKHFRYIGIVIDYENWDEQKRIVIDIPEDFKNEGIIVTIY